MRFVCTADIHIGRASSCDVDGACDLSSSSAFNRIVGAAIEGEANAVLIAGDLFDNLAAQYEFRRQTVQQLHRLRDHGIPVIAVAGNHDYSALPRLVSSVSPGLMQLLGTKWEQVRVEGLDGVRFVGRSFAHESERTSMFREFDLPAADEITVGLVHADINAQSPYGPTPLSDFSGRGVSAWVVGHVHVPRTFDGLGCGVAYCGSPQALDWGECGVHGFRWLTIENGKAQFGGVIPVSTVRYEYANVDLTPTCDLDNKLRAIADRYRTQCPQLASVQFRVDVRLLEGGNHAQPNAGGPIALGPDGYQVCSWTHAPSIDLEIEAKLKDARGQAARLLLGLRGEARWKPAAAALVERVTVQMAAERKRLAMQDEEDLRCLREPRDGEAQAAVERSLERILSGNDGGAE